MVVAVVTAAVVAVVVDAAVAAVVGTAQQSTKSGNGDGKSN